MDCQSGDTFLTRTEDLFLNLFYRVFSQKLLIKNEEVGPQFIPKMFEKKICKFRYFIFSLKDLF
ncbi:hypothetical protein AXI59_05410 [Bacillus nakamurai]|uniref:Uncharacterized protein n=1 Tax=Bacillus nakamurai TaxID=1793963 RepID=A0A150F594_9BACI|nr:hypothetical protein AXI59_05410 [Bacillus nakamurai]KXZ17520.1 hypothetical protein AXI58_19170 [Bacillus nakamurai]